MNWFTKIILWFMTKLGLVRKSNSLENIVEKYKGLDTTATTEALVPYRTLAELPEREAVVPPDIETDAEKMLARSNEARKNNIHSEEETVCIETVEKKIKEASASGRVSVVVDLFSGGTLKNIETAKVVAQRLIPYFEDKKRRYEARAVVPRPWQINITWGRVRTNDDYTSPALPVWDGETNEHS